MEVSNAVQYHFGLFPPNGLKYEQFISNLIQATDSIARFDQMLKNMHNSEILLAPLRNQEAVISSRMEGTISTIDEILMFEANSEDDKEEAKKFRSEVYETILYQRTLKAAQEAINKGYGFNEHLIRTMHQQLLSFGRGANKTPGRYKVEQNYLADKTKQKILFVPISPEKLQEGMELLFKYIENENDPILIKSAIMHLEFEALHPFQDGNGRIGRMLITLLLWKTKTITAPHFYISGYLEENKDLYIDCMRRVSEKGVWEEWIAFFLKAVDEQAKRNLKIAENIRQLYEEMKYTFSEVLSSKWSVEALDFIFTNPIFRNNRFTSKGNIPAPTAARFTRVLQEKGLITLVQESSGRRPALYSFEPLLKLVRV